MGIDWEEVAGRIGGLDINDNEVGIGTAGGRRALEILLGEQNIRDAVDYWNSQRPGCFTVEMVLSIIRSKVAMERCYEVYKSERGSSNSCSAVFLLKSIADAEALPWVREFLEDSNLAVRLNGVGVLRRILDGPLGDRDSALAKGLLDKGQLDADPEVRERIRQVRAHLPQHNADLK